MFRRRRGASARPVKGRWLRRLDSPLRWLGTLLVLLSIGAGGYQVSRILLDPEKFPLRSIELYGERVNVGKADLQYALEAYLGTSFFTLDIEELRNHLLDNPWLEQVSVRRQWPDTLEVRFQERKAFGHWNQHEMVDINGVRFQPISFRRLDGWPHLFGLNGNEKRLIQIYQEASGQIDELGLKITRLVQDHRWAWRIQFDNGIEIELGKEQLRERLMRFVAVYPNVLAARIGEIETVDLRYVNGFAVRWKTTPSTAG